MEAAAPASAGSFREESAALGWEWGGVGVGALDGEGGARWTIVCQAPLSMEFSR